MKELLLSEINHEAVEPLEAVALIEKFIFDHKVDVDEVKLLAEHCQKEVADIENTMERAEQVINEIYVHQLFIDNKRHVWPVVSHQIHNALSYRIMAPVLKSIMLQYIIERSGFDTDIVFVPEKVMVRITCDDDFAIVFDPVTGESLSWQDLDDRLTDFDNEPHDDFVQSIDTQDILYKYVSSLKDSLINELQFDKALKCVDVLLAMRPDDPFERRDRGFLLHQLDCFKVAYDDYRFFVEQCPQDPAAQLLKHQLDNITVNDTILH
ncbi:tetratricopeptide repeat protein [Thalassotalea agariperforans]